MAATTAEPSARSWKRRFDGVLWGLSNAWSDFKNDKNGIFETIYSPTMARVIGYLLVDLFLCLALFDQIIWESHQATLRPFARWAAVVLYLPLCLDMLRYAWRFRGNASPRIFLRSAIIAMGQTVLLLLAMGEYSIWWSLGVASALQCLCFTSTLRAPPPALLMTWLAPALLVYAFCSQQSLRIHEALQGSTIPAMHGGLWLGVCAVSILLWKVLSRSSLGRLGKYSVVLPPGVMLGWVLAAAVTHSEVGGLSFSISHNLTTTLCFWVLLLRSLQPTEQSWRTLQRHSLGLMWSVALLLALHVLYVGITLWQVLPERRAAPFTLSDRFVLYLLTAEDPIFYFHGGVDYFRLNDAIRQYVDGPAGGRGGSTISMQLVKVLRGEHDRTLSRKYSQIVSAFLLELAWGKKEILDSYLSVIPFAPGVIGIEAAAQKFFSTTPARLNDEQALTLVLSIFDPGYFNPGLSEMPPDIRRRAIIIRSRAQRFESKLHPR